MNNMNRSITKADMIEIMQGISKKVPTSGGIAFWQPETDYVENQIILHNATLYRVTENFTSGLTFNDTKLEMIGGGSLKEWEANTEYSENNILVYEGQIYKALVKFISGTTFDKTEILEEYTLAGGETPILWAKGEEITTNDIVEYDGNYYKALVDFTCGEEFTTIALEEYVPQPLTEDQIEEVIDAYEPEFDGMSITDDLKRLIYFFRKSNTAYSVEDVAYSHKLPSYLCLECVKAGTTEAIEPDFFTVEAGQYVTDGTVTWIVTDVRDGAQVGDIKMSPILRKGYVKANGALLTDARTNYPRLVNFVQENPSLLAADDTVWNSNNALYVYDDTNDTLRVPDATGRVLQGGASVQSVEAGLPNITGFVNFYAAGGGPAGNGQNLPCFGRGSFAPIGDLSSRSLVSLNGSNTGYYSSGMDFNASKSSPIYSASTTVQPPALSLIPQIKY